MPLPYAFGPQSRLRSLRAHLVFRIIGDLLNDGSGRGRLLGACRGALSGAPNCIYLRVFLSRFGALPRDVPLLAAVVAGALVTRITRGASFRTTEGKLTRASSTTQRRRAVAGFNRRRSPFISAVRTPSGVIMRSWEGSSLRGLVPRLRSRDHHALHALCQRAEVTSRLGDLGDTIDLVPKVLPQPMQEVVAFLAFRILVEICLQRLDIRHKFADGLRVALLDFIVEARRGKTAIVRVLNEID